MKGTPQGYKYAALRSYIFTLRCYNGELVLTILVGITVRGGFVHDFPAFVL